MPCNTDLKAETLQLFEELTKKLDAAIEAGEVTLVPDGIMRRISFQGFEDSLAPFEENCVLNELANHGSWITKQSVLDACQYAGVELKLHG